ncbi:uncharacterized protein I303_104154 [Kwoniella dejecticola CBS 10117]|uniref:NAD-dependent epimerase/dehydratase n=1 Tax=Kwoniella dejecticola CBS 10117 TaxID=1296121 RepID=A0A1A6A642_9TREE|nr:NAD-dependent epimerase/dehydratase [Kwoniella dejecticola CBS 10117]OBR85532.1 NAD-dependent epimerase/dehydratase [Kwoniella dejecticola CBS 10117]
MSGSFKIPSFVETVLVTGAGGFVGQKLVIQLLNLYPNIKVIATDIVEPPNHGITDKAKLRTIKADLGKPAELAGIFEGEKIGGFFALHGIMSGGSEANFPLGYSVNIDSHRALLDAAHKHAEKHFSSGPKPVYVFASSLAVYGAVTPQSVVDPKTKPVVPESSYGVQKHVVEMIVYDYGRKGYLDTRTVRLVTVTVRPGAPSSAASSYISGMIREPLQGQESPCPIADSIDDPALDYYLTWVGSTKTVVKNIIHAATVKEDDLKAVSQERIVNLPGIQITPRQIIQALIKYGGEDKLKLIKFGKDPKVIAICDTWAGAFDNTDALKLGFSIDDEKTGYEQAVQDFIQEELGGKIA